MKRVSVTSGAVLAIIRKQQLVNKPFAHLVVLNDRVDARILGAEVAGFVGTSSVSDFVFKAAFSTKVEPAVREWLKLSGAKLDAERVIAVGETREVEFHEDTGRIRIELAKEGHKSVREVAAAGVARPATQPELVRVLVVDDSKAMRMVLRKILESSPKFKVIGEADRPSEAIKFLERELPDVLTLDIQMPEMSGVELYKIVRDRWKIPAVMVSALGMNEGREVMDALEAGAFDYFQKPDAGEIENQAPVLHEKVFQAAVSARRRVSVSPRASTGQAVPLGALGKSEIFAVGASTGGTEAVRQVFELLPEDIPPTVVVQHIPPFFSAAFAERLNRLCRFEVREARDGDELRKGLALVAPGGFHLEVERKGHLLIARVTDSAPVNRFKPSVDVLFKSVANVIGKHATGLILTGMGNDGAKGMLEMRKAGARTIGQDEASSIVYGMPRAAFEIGAVMEVAALSDIANVLTQEKKPAKKTEKKPA